MSRRRSSGPHALFAWTVLGFLVLGSAANAVIRVTQSDVIDDPREWTSVILFSAGERYCSSTVVGARVVLTAAHCITGGERAITAWVKGDTATAQYEMKCEIHPKFDSNPAADYALCRTDKPLAIDQVARVNGRVEKLSKGSVVTLAGYGCRDEAVQNFNGTLSLGRAAVQTAPEDSTEYTILTGDRACFGDAGGGAFIDTAGGRVLVGVLSRIDGMKRSWISPTTAKVFVEWAERWSEVNGAQICGLSKEEKLACTPRPGEAPIVPESALKNANVIMASYTSAPTVVASSQPGRTNWQLRTITYRKDERIADVIKFTCFGAADDEFVDRTLEYLSRQGLVRTRDDIFRDSGTLNVPVCPVASVVQDRIEIEVRPGERQDLWYYFRRLQEDKKLRGKWGFEREPGDRRSPNGRDSRYYVEVFKFLNASQNPGELSPGKVVLPLRPSNAGDPVSLPVASTEYYEPILVAQNAETPCIETRDPLSYPFNIEALANVLAANSEKRTQKSSARIVLADSGLYAPGRAGSIFREDMLYPSKLWKTPEQREDALKGMDPRVPKPEDAAHGTWVASAALGGALFARIQAAMGSSTILLDPYRLHEARATGNVIIPAESFLRLFDRLDQTIFFGRIIVNLSQRSSSELRSVYNRLGDQNPNFLFIVAAGNGVGSGPDNQGQILDENTASFPAVYGGHNNKGRANLLSVAALYRDKDGAWQRARFSDFGPKIVEIGAPGCAVPVFDYNKEDEVWASKPRFVNGTSFSAPLVSFTAALISSEINTLTASEIKQRILAAADLNPGLTRDITDGRSLNVPKSVAIYYDLIELDGGLQLGTITLRDREKGNAYGWNQTVPIKCNNEQTDLRLNSILKIVPGFNIRAGSMIGSMFPDRVYVGRGEGQQPEPLDCKLPDDVVVSFTRNGTVASPLYSWSDLQDIIPRIPSLRAKSLYPH